MRKKFLFICLSWLIALTANADNLTLYLTIYGLTADPNSTTPYYTTDTSIEEGTEVTINYSGVDAKTTLSIYINGEVVSRGKILQMIRRPYTFTAKKNCILRVEGNYAFNSATNPNVYFTQDVDVTGVTLSQTEAAMTVGGETLTLTATVAPDDAKDKTVTWTTSDASVAIVTNGVVTAVAAGTATITATATNGTADTSDDFSATCEVTVAAPATKYNLTKADGSEAHGTVAFTVGGAAATQAEKDDVVTVSVTPNEGYSAKGVTVRTYTSWEAASEILTGGGDNPGLVSDINVAKQENGTWTFTMPEANVWVVVTYTKNLQDAWIQTIADQTYTGSAITPTVTVKDGETTLVLNTDYTVAYSNNTNVGTGTVTVTGTGTYSGTATANFTIVADKSALNTAITEAETYYNKVSIIVSSSDPDNVEYDSEHFKGTLVDKTFTDEDMQEVDHYVLSGGSSFVWVKDAGVLSAGKCWIQLEKSPANARALSIVFEGELTPTGISTVKTTADTKDATVYDLQGRHVMQPTKGLFIVGVKKVVIK